MQACRACRRQSAGWRALGASLAIRTAVVAATVGVALSVPRFAYIMAFTGGLLGLPACIVVPAVCYLQIKRGCAHACYHACINGMPDMPCQSRCHAGSP
jgi:vesicular inhibitory amino acid transporter